MVRDKGLSRDGGAWDDWIYFLIMTSIAMDLAQERHTADEQNCFADGYNARCVIFDT